MKKKNLVYGLLMTTLVFLMGTIQVSAKQVCYKNADVADEFTEKKIKLSGVVLDYETKEPLAKAALKINADGSVHKTNSKGMFKLKCQVGDTIFVQCGNNYIPEKIAVIDSEEPLTILLKRGIPPLFPGGYGALMEFLAKNLKYPKEALDNKIEGRVMVRFIVHLDGNVVDPIVVESVHPVLDAEAIRVIKLLPKWEPAKQGGKAVRTSIHVPLNFQLPQAKTKIKK